jgi:hypothetical protein
MHVQLGRRDSNRESGTCNNNYGSIDCRIRKKLKGGWGEAKAFKPEKKMAEYLSPGVYVEEFESGMRPMEGVSTSTAGFIGMAEKGKVIGHRSLFPALQILQENSEDTYPKIHMENIVI